MIDLNDFRHRYDLQLRFSDFDMMGHVNNARFLTFIEDARIDYLEQVLKQPLTKPDYASVVAHLTIDYKAPVLPYDEACIYSRTEKTGGKSITLVSRVIRFPNGNTGEAMVAAECKSVLVTVEKATGRAINHPQELADGIRAMENQ